MQHDLQPPLDSTSLAAARIGLNGAAPVSTAVWHAAQREARREARHRLSGGAVEAEAKWLPPDVIADRYASEFYGSRLLRLKHGTAPPRMVNALLSAVWPKGSDGTRLFLVDVPETDGHCVDLERDGFDVGQAYRETRDWLLGTLLPRFIGDLQRKHGSLEAAVAAGHARGLRRWVAWRFLDELRRQFRASDELALERERDHPSPTETRERERALWGDVDIWARADAAGLSAQDRDMLELFRDGLTNGGIGYVLDCGGEANVRKRLKKLHVLLGLRMPPRRRGRPRRPRRGTNSRRT